MGLIDRAQLHSATERGQHRLAKISDQLTEAGRENVLTELVTADDITGAWDTMDLSRQRSVITSLMTITVHPAGRGNRSLDPVTITISWLQDDAPASKA
jgi:site-specific DNA recombinase